VGLRSASAAETAPGAAQGALPDEIEGSMSGKAGFRFAVESPGLGWTPEACVPEVPYPPALAERVRLLHTQLVHIFARVATSYRRGAFERCVVHLRHFHEQLRSYLCGEGAELETYLSERLAREPDRLLTLRQVRTRLRSLALTTAEMTEAPRAGRLNPAWTPGFLTTFESMGLNLASCVDTIELDFLPICPPSLDHHAWSAAGAGAVFAMSAEASTAEWIVLQGAPSDARAA
jgi:hypothetical protein